MTTVRRSTLSPKVLQTKSLNKKTSPSGRLFFLQTTSTNLILEEFYGFMDIWEAYLLITSTLKCEGFTVGFLFTNDENIRSLTGLGIADTFTERLVRRIDFDANVIVTEDFS
jgi:hypothetical protein